jgi:hypothetical protein
MRKVKQILRLKLEVGMSNRAISRACNVGRETIRDYLIRFQESGLTWPEVAQMDEADVEVRGVPAKKLLLAGPPSTKRARKRVSPCDCCGRSITNPTLPLLIATASFVIFTSNGKRSCLR